ncbi:receptor tyrosine kinase-like protein [Aphelenchoides avenae]|nr:receptor tyrosine kinase-like protein [Aphelenchus avenae]
MRPFSTGFGVVLLAALCVEARFNLYITRQEMNRTLGILAELRYVDNGVVSGYSTKFPYRIDANISHIEFTWNSTVAKGKEIRYSVHPTGDFDVIPILHFPKEGYLPRKTEPFSVEYRCAGSRAGQFHVFLHFNVSFPSEQNFTYFTLKQEKICASKDGRRALAGSLDDTDPHGLRMDSTGTSEVLSSSQLWSLAALCVAAVIAIVGTLLCIYLRSNRKGRFYDDRHGGSTVASFPTKDTSLFDTASTPFLVPSVTPLIKTTSPKLAALTVLGTSKEPKIIFQRSNVVDINNALVELNADRNLFQTMPFVELEGSFGEVRWAIWRQNAGGFSGDIDDEEDGANEDTAQFLKDVLVFHNVPPHPNLAQVIAAATFGNFNNPDSVKDFPLISYRHQGFGNLKKFLLTCRGATPEEDMANVASTSSGIRPGTSSKNTSNSGYNQTLRTHDLVSMAIQVLKAVQHLHRYGVIHKDIATRNCLVAEVPIALGDRLAVQISDNALSKDLFPEDYQLSEGGVLRPLRWMSPDAMRSNVYNSASDVWAFAVLVWELFTCAKQPYEDLNVDDLEESLKKGVRLGQPYNCPDDLYALMISAWDKDPLERPSANALLSKLIDFTQQLRKYI